MSDPARAAYLAAAAAHAGFQATVTVVVYPGLARVRPGHWREQHDRHSVAITPLVGAVYVALVATSAWLLVVDQAPLAIAAVVPAALAMLVTALVAAPLHRQLVRRDEVALARLLAVDRIRSALAALALLLALVVALR